MKKTIVFAMLALSTAAFAKSENTCKYYLYNENYAEDTSGVLILDGNDFMCKQFEPDSPAICLDGENDIGISVALDGAEADFFVREGDEILCRGTAIDPPNPQRVEN